MLIPPGCTRARMSLQWSISALMQRLIPTVATVMFSAAIIGTSVIPSRLKTDISPIRIFMEESPAVRCIPVWNWLQAQKSGYIIILGLHRGPLRIMISRLRKRGKACRRFAGRGQQMPSLRSCRIGGMTI